MTNYENFYSGTKSTFQPEYSGFESYRLIKNIGAPTSPQTANQVEEVNKLLNQGMKTIEFSALSPDIFETVPKEHLKEINRLSKLTGNEMTIHGPMIDPSGFTKEGWSPYEREEAERRLTDSVIRAHELNPKGNIPVVIHASSLPAGEVQKGEMLIAVNQETGQLIPLRKEKRFYPEGEKDYTPEMELKMMNNTQWVDHISNLLYYQRYGDAELKEAYALLGAAEHYKKAVEGKKEEGLSLQEQQQVETGRIHFERAKAFYQDVEAKLRNIYHQAWKYNVEQERTDIPVERREEVRREIKKSLEKIKNIWQKTEEIDDPGIRSEILNKTIVGLKQIPAPPLYKPIEDFALQHSAKTLGNAAFAGYEKFKNTAPIIAVENMFPNMAFSSAEQLSKLINESRKVFADNAVKKGISRTDAENQAEKLIGATWDIGHLNLLRKGYPEKEAERLILSQTKEIAPLVKHVHVTDNFGHADTHLPPGMGNVPVKKIMEELEKRGYSGKQIMEAGGFVQHFKLSPYPYVLEALDSPMYAQQLGPSWSQARALYGSYYFSGYGPTLPEQHMGMYGAGFSGLPTELGGQVGGAGRRFAGTPME
jgi:sugar phosphate isomerase/epimerase